MTIAPGSILALATRPTRCAIIAAACAISMWVTPLAAIAKPLDVEKDEPKAYLEVAQAVRDARYLEFSQLDKVYATPKGPLKVVDKFDLKVTKGEFISLIGHSGCGKSTVLSTAAGLNDISGGGIILDGREMHAAGPDRAAVFKAPSLFPWLSAFDNVVAYYLDRVGLGDAMRRPAVDLSNGMKQRVGIARTFALSPKLLLDEPFGMLDSLTRCELQEVLMEVWSRTKVTAICVTHDVDEAILLTDRVVMMTNGPNAQIGNIMNVDLPRPRTRKALLDHARYWSFRQKMLDFLEAYEGGAAPSPAVLEAIRSKRAAQSASGQSAAGQNAAA